MRFIIHETGSAIVAGTTKPFGVTLPAVPRIGEQIGHSSKLNVWKVFRVDGVTWYTDKRRPPRLFVYRIE